MEYAGDLITQGDARVREVEYSHDNRIGSYMYYFTFENIKWCIDATIDSGKYGRLLNHSKRKPNCSVQIIKVCYVKNIIIDWKHKIIM